MARDHARVNVAIWGDPEFKALPPAAQHLYLLLWTSPGLSYCGTHDWRPARLSGFAHGWTRTQVDEAAACLAARYFVVVDEGTEEILLRSWVRFDGLMKQPRMAISAISAYSAVSSTLIQSVVVSELLRLRESEPDLSAWRDERVINVLTHPAAEGKGWPTPDDPFGDGFAPTVTPGLDETQGKVWVPPTPAPTPATNSSPNPEARKRETALSPDWSPTADHIKRAKELGVDVIDAADNFRLHAETHDRRAASWNGAFTTWLKKSQPTGRSKPKHKIPANEEFMYR